MKLIIFENDNKIKYKIPHFLYFQATSANHQSWELSPMENAFIQVCWYISIHGIHFSLRTVTNSLTVHQQNFVRLEMIFSAGS